MLGKSILMRVINFSRLLKILKKCRIFQPKYYMADNLSEDLLYLSQQIKFVEDEVNIALVRGKPVPRKSTQWVKEATALKCQVDGALKEEKKTQKSSLKPEELKHLCEQIYDCLKQCPVEGNKSSFSRDENVQSFLSRDTRESEYGNLASSKNKRAFASESTWGSTFSPAYTASKIPETLLEHSTTEYVPEIQFEEAFEFDVNKEIGASQVFDAKILEISKIQTSPNYLLPLNLKTWS